MRHTLMTAKETFSTFFNKQKKTAVVMLLMVMFLTGISYHAASLLIDQRVQNETENSSASNLDGLENIGGDWWESRQFIYHDIPARIVFSLPSGTADRPNAVNKKTWLEFERIGRIFNPFNPDSEISHLNSPAQSKSVAVSEDISSVIRISQLLWIDSDGLFDPTMWQIKRLWQNAEKVQQMPGEKDIAAALQWTGFDQVRLDGKNYNSLQFKDHPVKFDFGGIVKGYAVDKVRQILLSSGVTAGLVQLGGEVSAFGKNNGKPWRIGIQHPKQMNKVWGVISSDDRIRVSTSGNYRQPILINGKSFYHIFSPKTGKPVSEKILGVTTASMDEKTSNARLDGIATAITVMGSDKGLAMAGRLNIEAVILYEKNDGSIGEYVTPGLSGIYEKNQ